MNVLDLPEHALTRLITDPTDARVATTFSSLDATGALTRGIAEYVATLSLTPGGPRAFQKCFDEWAEVEEDADYPSFAAYANESQGTYEQVNVSPHVGSVRYPNGTYEVSSSELAIDVKCEIWANDPNERALLLAMLETAFAPVEWMYGFRLELPHYFNQRATFSPMNVTRVGGEQEAMQRFVNARMILRANVPVTRILPFALGKPEARVSVGTALLNPPAGVDRAGKP